MFKKLQQLKQKKAQVVAEMRSILEQQEGDNLNEEQASKFDGLRNLAKELDEEISRVESVIEAETR